MEQPPGHAIPKQTVIATYVGLIVLTALMVGISRINTDILRVEWMDLHALKGWIVMGIALVMGIITAMFLMGLAFEHKLLNVTIFVSNFVFLLIFVVFTWADTSFRGEMEKSHAQTTGFQSPVKASAGSAPSHGTGVKPQDAAAPQGPQAAPPGSPAPTGNQGEGAPSPKSQGH